MKKLIVVSLSIAAALLSACGSSPSTGGPGPTSVPTTSVTAQEIAALAERVFPKVAQYGYYGVCGVDGNLSACPYTDRLKARLTELGQTLARAQNPSDTREVTAEIMGPNAGIAHVKLFQGRSTLDLWVVKQGQTLLVDDEVCAGRKETSIYATVVACDAGSATGGPAIGPRFASAGFDKGPNAALNPLVLKLDEVGLAPNKSITYRASAAATVRYACFLLNQPPTTQVRPQTVSQVISATATASSDSTGEVRSELRLQLPTPTNRDCPTGYGMAPHGVTLDNVRLTDATNSLQQDLGTYAGGA